MEKLFLSVIVPTYNEETRIDECFKKLNKYFLNQKYSYEIIFVDDGSTDGTMPKLKAQSSKSKNWRMIENKANHGKGFVVRQGVLAAQGKYVLVTDTDLSTPIENLEKLLPFADKFPIIIGSRYLNKGSIKLKQPFLRRVMSRVGNLLIRIMLGLNFADTQCGFKLFASDVAKDIFSRAKIDRWGFDMEILAIAKKQGVKIKEVSVSWYNDPHSQLRAGRAAWDTLKELFRIKGNLITGRYFSEKPLSWLGRILVNNTFRQFVKFCIVGASGTAVDWIVYFILNRWFLVFYLLAKALSFILAAINNYIWNRIWTFGSHEKHIAIEFGKFFIVSLVGLGLNILIMYLAVDKLKFNDFWGLVLATASVMMWNFLANKFWTFRKRRGSTRT